MLIFGAIVVIAMLGIQIAIIETLADVLEALEDMNSRLKEQQLLIDKIANSWCRVMDSIDRLLDQLKGDN